MSLKFQSGKFRPSNLPSIPAIPFNEPTKPWLDAMKETLEIWRGERRTSSRKLDAVVTYQDLIDLGLIIKDQVPK